MNLRDPEKTKMIKGLGVLYTSFIPYENEPATVMWDNPALP